MRRILISFIFVVLGRAAGQLTNGLGDYFYADDNQFDNDDVPGGSHEDCDYCLGEDNKLFKGSCDFLEKKTNKWGHYFRIGRRLEDAPTPDESDTPSYEYAYDFGGNAPGEPGGGTYEERRCDRACCASKKEQCCDFDEAKMAWFTIGIQLRSIATRRG
mmetsp:Transcript_29615/g.88560  ORF Transcript_29615/g.88560 Transcript_29615/m.88560 type:complete len:159 (-) Transcript_29615:321-797(-)